jgi:hypothetical protein
MPCKNNQSIAIDPLRSLAALVQYDQEHQKQMPTIRIELIPLPVGILEYIEKSR